MKDTTKIKELRKMSDEGIEEEGLNREETLVNNNAKFNDTTERNEIMNLKGRKGRKGRRIH